MRLTNCTVLQALAPALGSEQCTANPSASRCNVDTVANFHHPRALLWTYIWDLHILEVDGESPAQTLDDRLKTILARYVSSRPFGAVLHIKPTLLAVFPEAINWYIYELYYVRLGIYFGVGIDLVKQAEGDVVKVPIWVS